MTKTNKEDRKVGLAYLFLLPVISIGQLIDFIYQLSKKDALDFANLSCYTISEKYHIMANSLV